MHTSTHTLYNVHTYQITALRIIALRCITFHWLHSYIHDTTFHYIALHYGTLTKFIQYIQNITLHGIALHCISLPMLDYITLNYSIMDCIAVHTLHDMYCIPVYVLRCMNAFRYIDLTDRKYIYI